ncbi:nicotinate (nicotinamide) nucleotide adenylyltransferase [Rhodoferax sp.]|uniref:nicotinate (nicotinamide) nucleotide adenylyltransferase n=1 Tax=Rhodoferax sp. TaxID=50421 RepID=UPI00378357FD
MNALAPQRAVPRIGVFGGAFDPPHRAHVALACAAVQQLSLDSLRVVPTGLAWHKARALSDAQHRLAMCALAFAEVPNVQVDDRETRRTGPSYTADTLLEIQAENPHAHLYLLIGQDQALALPRWQRWDEVVRTATICVASRPGSSHGYPGSAESTSDSRLADLESLSIPDCIQIDLPPMELSATEVRHHAGMHHPITQWVSEPVARYIENHHLYQADR